MPQVDILNRSALADKCGQQPANDTDEQGSQQGAAEAVHIEAADDPGGHHQEQGVDDKGEQAEAENVQREGQNQQDGSEEGVQNSQNGRSQNGRGQSRDANAIDHVRGHEYGKRQKQPSDDDPFQWIAFMGESGGVRLSGSVDLVAQFPGAFERDHATFGQHHLLAGGRISAFAPLFFLHAKLTETTHQHILSG